MPSLPELQTEALKWQRRIGLLSNAGVNPAPVQELAKTDLQRIIQGGTPLPEDQIVSMVTAAYTGQTTTGTPGQQSGPDFNPLHILGSIPKDVTTDVRSFMPGIVHEVADIANPSKYGQLASDIGKFQFGDPSTMAKEVAALPIVGKLIPGTFALTAGWKGLTDHPLNMALDVLPYVSQGSKLATLGVTEAEAGTALSALREGHPLQAVGRATGIESKLMDFVQKHAGEANYMPIWRTYNELVRVYARRLVEEEMTNLDRAGLLPKSLSEEQRQSLVIDAQRYNSRYETPAITMNGQLKQAIDAAPGDPHNWPIPQGHDIQAWAVGADPLIAPLSTREQPVYFSPQDAAQNLPEGVDPNQLIHEVRVNPGDLTYSNGTYTARNLLANRSYSPEYSGLLKKIQDFSTRHEARTTKNYKNLLTGEEMKAPKAYVTDPITGRTEVVRRNSKIFRAHQKLGTITKQRQDVINQLRANDATILERENQAAGRTAQFARYGESAADAAKRPPTLPTTVELYNHAQEFILQGMYGPDRAIYERIDAAFQRGNSRQIRAALNELRNKIGTSTARDAEKTYANYLYNQAKSIKSREAAAVRGVGALKESHNRRLLLEGNLRKLDRIHETAQKDFYRELTTTPPERALPLIGQEVRGQVLDAATQTYLQNARDVAKTRMETMGGGVAEAISQSHDEYARLVSRITDATTREELANIVGSDTFKQIEQNAMQDWAQMAKAGYDPIWLHEVNPQHYYNQTFGEVKALPDRLLKGSDWKERAFNYDAQVLDISAVLTSQAAEYMTEEATRQFIDWMVNKSGAIATEQAIRADLEKRGFDPLHITQHLKNDYVPFDPHAYVPTWKQTRDTYLMPRDLSNGFDQLMGPGKKVPFFSTSPIRAGHKIFKVAVLTGPRHIVHVTIGGLVMTALREPGAVVELLTHGREIFQWMKGGDLPQSIKDVAPYLDPTTARYGVQKGQYEESIHEIASPLSDTGKVDQAMQFRAGKRLGEWFRESAAKRGLTNAAEWVNTFENMTTDMYRASIWLDQMKHGATNEAALAAVNKTLIDVDNLTPFERTVVRQVFPFWTYTKHILRYVLTYPADHPVRASILASLARNIEESKGNADPANLSKLFFLGTPDANGTIKTADMSNLNPFRSMASVFSMSGFLMGLGPEFQTGLRMLGINPLTGTPSLHQNFSYDAYTGTNRATRPKNNIFDFAQAFIPQVELIDHFLLLSDTMKSLKQNNPTAYSRAFWSEMNLPFTLAPINIYDTRAKAAAAQYRDAQTAVSNAMKTGNTDPIRSFIAVPFQGQLYDANQVANYIDNFDKLFPGIAPRATIRKPRARRKKVL